MAHFAKLGTGNIVEKVEVVSNDIATNEQAGVDFLNNLYGTRDVWKQTSYNGNIRKNYAGVGFTYNETLDAFIPPCDYQGWKFNQELCKWEVPVPYPSDGKQYYWNNIICNWSLNE